MSRCLRASLVPVLTRSVVFLGALLTVTCAGGQQTTLALPDAPDTISSSSASDAPVQEQPQAETQEQSGDQKQNQTSRPQPTPVQETPGGPTNIPPPSGEGVQSKRILGIIPNFQAVNADVKLPPQTAKEKFLTATENSFDYSAFVLPAIVSVVSYERNTFPEFGSGGVGYGRYLWHAVVDHTVENYMVEFVGPALTHEDTRYYTLGRGPFLKRAGYSLSRIVITRTDHAEPTFNISEVAGTAAAAGFSQLYYPHQERTVGQFGYLWALNLGVDAGSFLIREFWPDINHLVFRPHTR